MQNITLNQFQANIVIEIERILNSLNYFGETYVIQKAVVTYLLNNNITSGNQEQIVINILSILFGINITGIPTEPTPTPEEPIPPTLVPTEIDPRFTESTDTGGNLGDIFGPEPTSPFTPILRR